jgi:hypothetical protein
MSVAHEVTGNMMSTKERTLSLKSVHLDVEHCPAQSPGGDGMRAAFSGISHLARIQ